jgi:thymidylate kinase
MGRKTYVKFMAHPKIVFYLKADPDVIYKRKQELTLEEIKRQNEIYLEVAKLHPRFKILDANRHYDESVNEVFNKTYVEKHGEELKSDEQESQEVTKEETETVVDFGDDVGLEIVPDDEAANSLSATAAEVPVQQQQ